MEASAGTLNDNLTLHALARMGGRGINHDAVQAALDYGRVVRIRGAEIHALGRKEVARLARHDIDLAEYEGVQVVCSHEGKIVTVYRNHDFSGLRTFRVRRRNRAA
jgi:hypothetical protein